jgi:AhpD family alkylhydroperoxidase
VTRIFGLPEKDAGLLGRFAYRFSRRRFGKVPEPVRVTAHHPKVLLGGGAMELALDRSDLVDARLKKLAEMKVALLVGCEFCVDIGSKLGKGLGISDDQLRELPRFRESVAFSPVEKLVLEYAAGMTGTRRARLLEARDGEQARSRPSWRSPARGARAAVAARRCPRAWGLRSGGPRGAHAGGDGAIAHRVKRATTWRMDLSQPVKCRDRLPALGWCRRIALLSAYVAALLVPMRWSRK